MLVCQITDLHVKPRGALAYRVVDTPAYLRRCIAHILAQPQRPDVVVATGDLTDSAVAATSPSPAHQVALDLEPDAHRNSCSSRPPTASTGGTRARAW